MHSSRRQVEDRQWSSGPWIPPLQQDPDILWQEITSTVNKSVDMHQKMISHHNQDRNSQKFQELGMDWN